MASFSRGPQWSTCRECIGRPQQGVRCCRCIIARVRHGSGKARRHQTTFVTRGVRSQCRPEPVYHEHRQCPASRDRLCSIGILSWADVWFLPRSAADDLSLWRTRQRYRADAVARDYTVWATPRAFLRRYSWCTPTKSDDAASSLRSARRKDLGFLAHGSHARGNDNESVPVYQLRNVKLLAGRHISLVQSATVASDVLHQLISQETFASRIPPLLRDPIRHRLLVHANDQVARVDFNQGEDIPLRLCFA
jgi:hypothetical protein